MRVGLIKTLSTVMTVTFVAGLFSISGPVGCSGKSIDENDPAALYKDAEDDISNDRYQSAIDKLRIVKNKFPYSKYAVDAQLRIADVYYLQESYPEAAQAYESFRDLHPKHEKVAYAMFRAGKSYYNDIPSTVARDLTPATHALDALGEFVQRFPNAPEAKEARDEITDVRKTLAEKDFYIGNFYLRQDDYSAAKARFQKLIELYPETKAAEEAKAKIEKIGNKTTKKEDNAGSAK